jgi:hypothetical protein
VVYFYRQKGIEGMTLRHSNLLLSDETPPVAGIQYDYVVAWYGGRLNVVAEGDLGAATIELLGSIRLPLLAVNESYADVMTDEDFFVLYDFTDGPLYNECINPCMLAVRVTGAPGAGLKIVVN